MVGRARGDRRGPIPGVLGGHRPGRYLAPALDEEAAEPEPLILSTAFDGAATGRSQGVADDHAEVLPDSKSSAKTVAELPKKR